jgi:hypothetical protein
MHTDGPVKAMARELLERRGRDKQEPDGWQFLGVNGLWVNVTENGMRQALKEGSEVRALYAAPQLPQPAVEALKHLRSIVADPKTLPRRKEWISGQQYSYVLLESVEAMVDDACRAAMLQGKSVKQPSSIKTSDCAGKGEDIKQASSNEPVSQRDEFPEGWVAVPVDMTPEQMRAVQLNSELGAYAASNLTGAYSLFREFWDVAVKSVPNQEAE